MEQSYKNKDNNNDNDTYKSKSKSDSTKHSIKKALLVIDDRPIREQAYSEAKKLINKIDNIEEKIENFRNHDQKLFSDWFNLTFRNKLKKIEDLQLEYANLSRFHNWVVATSKIKKISIFLAYKKMKEEENSYQSGGDEVRKQIEKSRAERDKYICDEIEREERKMYGDDDFGFDEFDGKNNEESANTNDNENTNDDESTDESQFTANRTEAQERELLRIKNMTDKKIIKLCRNRDNALAMLATALALAQTPEEYKIFLRVWENCPHKYQAVFAKEFFSKIGIQLSVVIKDMRLKIEDFDQAENQTEEDSNFNSNEDFQQDYVSRGSGRIKINAQEEEVLKILYRKIVRLLHPDMQQPESQLFPWQKKLWVSVQFAYKECDISKLNFFYRVALLRLKELKSLTLSEIQTSRLWLKDELKILERETKQIRNLPAWGFSKKKNYDSVSKRIEKDFDVDFKSILKPLRELQQQHEYFDLMSHSDLRTVHQTQQRQQRNRRSRPNRNTNINRSRASQSEQCSFFD